MYVSLHVTKDCIPTILNKLVIIKIVSGYWIIKLNNITEHFSSEPTLVTFSTVPILVKQFSPHRVSQRLKII